MDTCSVFAWNAYMSHILLEFVSLCFARKEQDVRLTKLQFTFNCRLSIMSLPSGRSSSDARVQYERYTGSSLFELHVWSLGRERKDRHSLFVPATEIAFYSPINPRCRSFICTHPESNVHPALRLRSFGYSMQPFRLRFTTHDNHCPCFQCKLFHLD